MDETIPNQQDFQKELAAAHSKIEAMRENFQRISHDIQSPVKKILSFTDLITMKLQGENDEAVREYVRRIEKNAATLAQLLRRLKDEPI